MSLPLTGVLPASTGAPPEPSLHARKPAGAVREQLYAKDEVAFREQLGEQADTSAARRVRKNADRGRAVIAAEKAEAGRSAEGAYEYRSDGLPEGVYEVERGFAELSSAQPGERLFEVLAEGIQEVPDVDIALEAGGDYRALDKKFTVRVTDGHLDLRFASPADQPLVNAVRVTHRPGRG
ncbi:malectin domain-containing carbohydrate-binding protein [Streptomyces sp. SAS_281]|uniref:malectin domain-containing carbohydrate-binding protein n=1 Tax=Streptomyces sp. SAS_281 TaxID=3412744 RepID=UPI00403C2B01